MATRNKGHRILFGGNKISSQCFNARFIGTGWSDCQILGHHTFTSRYLHVFKRTPAIFWPPNIFRPWIVGRVVWRLIWNWVTLCIRESVVSSRRGKNPAFPSQKPWATKEKAAWNISGENRPLSIQGFKLSLKETLLFKLERLKVGEKEGFIPLFACSFVSSRSGTVKALEGFCPKLPWDTWIKASQQAKKRVPSGSWHGFVNDEGSRPMSMNFNFRFPIPYRTMQEIMETINTHLGRAQPLILEIWVVNSEIGTCTSSDFLLLKFGLE